jgi:hypothetical protein
MVSAAVAAAALTKAAQLRAVPGQEETVQASLQAAYASQARPHPEEFIPGQMGNFPS